MLRSLPTKFRRDILLIFFFSSRRRHTRLVSDWSSDVCSSDLPGDVYWAASDIGMAHYPTYIGSCPVDITGVNTKDVLHAPLQGHQMTTVVTNDAFRLPGSAGGVENVERVRRGHWNAFVWLCRRHDFVPVAVAAWQEFRPPDLALQDDTCLRFVPSNSNRIIK